MTFEQKKNVCRVCAYKYIVCQSQGYSSRLRRVVPVISACICQAYMVELGCSDAINNA